MRSVNPREQKDKRVQQRRCIVTGRSQDRNFLIRFVVDSFGLIRFDLSENLPGRGFWISSSRDCIESAISKKLFQRVSYRSVSVPHNLVKNIENNLVKRVFFAVAQARRGNLLVCGKRVIPKTIKQSEVIIYSNAHDKWEFKDQSLDHLRAGHKIILTLHKSELIQVFKDEKIRNFTIVEATTSKDTMKNLSRRLIRDFNRLTGFRLNLAFGGLEKLSEGCIDSLVNFAENECAVI